jgi:hypothetical protein
MSEDWRDKFTILDIMEIIKDTKIININPYTSVIRKISL